MASDESKLSLNAQFKTAYQAYKESLKTRDYNQQIISARKAYQLGQELYGPEDISTANLALNLAIVLNKNKQIDEAEQLEPQIQSAYEKTHGNNLKKLWVYMCLLRLRLAGTIVIKCVNTMVKH